jgi:protein-disulfide isomerase
MISLTKAATAAALALIVFCAAPARAEMTKDEVNKAIEEYILAHPQVIMKSVDDYQRKAMQEKFSEAVEKNRDSLFADKFAPFIGNEKGDVTMIEFFDYNCGYCKKVFGSINNLAAEDKNLKIIFKELPILGPSSETASKWALAAHMQGKYFAFHQIMMAHKGPINDEVLEKAAKDAGLDMARVKSDIQSTDILVQIEKNRSLAGQMGISGTPAFIIGTEVIPGAVDHDALKAKIEEVRKANAPAPEPKKK